MSSTSWNNARAAIAQAQTPPRTFESRMIDASVANAEATLALADEQRTANLIAFRKADVIADPFALEVEIAQRLGVVVIT